MVHRDVIPINTRVRGYIKEIRFKEFQHVRKGDTLVIIDDSEYKLQLSQAEANVEQSEYGSNAIAAGIVTTESNVQTANAGASVAGADEATASVGIKAADAAVAVASAGVDEAKTIMENARKDYERFRSLLEKDAVTQQQYDNMKTQYDAACSRYENALAHRQQAIAGKETALAQQHTAAVRKQQADAATRSTASIKNEQRHRLDQNRAGTKASSAQRDLDKINLSYTVIVATTDGVMGRKLIEEGQFVQPGQLLTQIVSDNNVWVIANYRETQLGNIQVGMPVTFKADAVKGVTFNGKVQSISSNTGAGYSGVPVDNATGNFVKVEQRVPVRIELTADNKAADIARLVNGLNVECEVDY